MPNAPVTSSPERVPDIATALKSAGFDILASGPVSAGATVLLVTEGSRPEDNPRTTATDPGLRAARRLVGVLAEAILRDCGRPPVGATVVGADRAPDEIATLAGHRPPEALPWWFYATVDPDLDFADWRDSILCLTAS